MSQAIQYSFVNNCSRPIALPYHLTISATNIQKDFVSGE